MTYGQSKLASVIESTVNIIVGLGLSVVINFVVLKYQGHEVSWGQMTWLTGILTVVSFIRSYYLRRIFNWLHERKLNAYLKGETSAYQKAIEKLNWRKYNG